MLFHSPQKSLQTYRYRTLCLFIESSRKSQTLHFPALFDEFYPSILLIVVISARQFHLTHRPIHYEPCEAVYAVWLPLLVTEFVVQYHLLAPIPFLCRALPL